MEENKKKLFVGSLSFDTSEDALRGLFEGFGTVESVAIIRDRDSGRSQGFGFVEMSTPEEAQAAVDGLHEKEFDGRNLVVNIARPKAN